VPAIGNILYRPQREISCPLAIDVTRTPPIIGVSWRPEPVGLSPLTIWRNTGMYVIAPKRARPTTKPIELLAVKTRLRKSASGMIGSTARRSASTNSGRSTAAIPISAAISEDLQP
jgi:hypothetical protein